MMSIEKVLMNKNTGELCPGIRVQFFDKIYHKQELTKFEGCSIILRDCEHDGWLIFSGEEDAPEGTGPWVFVHKDLVDERCEVLDDEEPRSS